MPHFHADRDVGGIRQIHPPAGGRHDGLTGDTVDLGRDVGKGLVGAARSHPKGDLRANAGLLRLAHTLGGDGLHITGGLNHRAKGHQAKNAAQGIEGSLDVVGAHIDAPAQRTHLAAQAVCLERGAHVAPELAEEIAAVAPLESNLTITQEDQAHVFTISDRCTVFTIIGPRDEPGQPGVHRQGTKHTKVHEGKATGRWSWPSLRGRPPVANSQ